jgi:hypothetical protein
MSTPLIFMTGAFDALILGNARPYPLDAFMAMQGALPYACLA